MFLIEIVSKYFSKHFLNTIVKKIVFEVFFTLKSFKVKFNLLKQIKSL